MTDELVMTRHGGWMTRTAVSDDPVPALPRHQHMYGPRRPHDADPPGMGAPLQHHRQSNHPSMKPKHKEPQRARTSVIASPQDSRFADSPALAALAAKMSVALERRKRKTSWISDAVRAELYDRYTQMLADSESLKLDDFIGWVTEDGRYLAVEGNFVSFCAEYLQADEDEARGLWAEAASPG